MAMNSASYEVEHRGFHCKQQFEWMRLRPRASFTARVRNHTTDGSAGGLVQERHLIRHPYARRPTKVDDAILWVYLAGANSRRIRTGTAPGVYSALAAPSLWVRSVLKESISVLRDRAALRLSAVHCHKLAPQCGGAVPTANA